MQMSHNCGTGPGEPPSVKLDKRSSLTGLILLRGRPSCSSELELRSLRRSGQHTGARWSDACRVYRRSSGRVAHGEAHWHRLPQGATALHIVAAQAEQTVIRFVRRGEFLTATLVNEPVTDMDHPHGG